MLEVSPGERITTSRLAKEVGVSEAALYRHFPSKSKMFEGLIEFIEDTIFTRANAIIAEESDVVVRCEKVLTLVLTFAERNPGITRLLTGDVLAGETERLRVRVSQLFDRLETQLKQTLRDAEIREGVRPVLPINIAVNMLITTVDGRISQYVRSEFRRKPTEHWSEQWSVLMSGFFRSANTAGAAVNSAALSN